LDEEEFIPADSVLRVSLLGSVKSLKLSDVIDLNPFGGVLCKKILILSERADWRKTIFPTISFKYKNCKSFFSFG
jgi:hypothetical protein